MELEIYETTTKKKTYGTCAWMYSWNIIRNLHSAIFFFNINDMLNFMRSNVPQILIKVIISIKIEIKYATY